MEPTAASIAPVVRQYARGHCVPWHAHAWPQLLYASSGVLAVETANGSWVVPPQRGVWLPADTQHETRMLTEVELSSLYLQAMPGWSADCEVIEISPMLRELILAATRIDAGTALSARDAMVIGLIGHEIRSAARLGSPIPMPRDGRLAALCRRVIAAPSVEISLEQHSAEAGLTSKTATRLFQRELGLSFREWRQMVHVSFALAHLVQGVAVKVVATQLGYTPSAFAVMMRRSTGQSPGALRDTPARGAGRP